LNSLIPRSFCIFCTLFFVIIFTPAIYAVDGCSSASFKVADNINLEAGVWGMAVADFNNDGHLDIAVSPNNSTTHVAVLYGRGGNEKFGPPTYFPVGGQPQRMAVADFNGDGRPDLAVSLDHVANSNIGTLSILLNNGTGQFGAPILNTFQGDPIQPVPADLNNDGKIDIITGLSTGTTDGKVAVLLNNGAGVLSAAPNSPIITESATTLPIVGDFNEDTKIDFAIPGRGSVGGVDIRFGDGAGGFGPVVNIATGGFSFFVLQADFNKDNHQDLLYGNRLVLGTGTGSFGAPVTVAVPASDSVAIVGDVNNDTNLDVVSGGSGGVAILLGDGTGNLNLGKSYVSGFTTFGAGSAFAALGDFNEDGKKDLAAVQRSGLGILKGDGTGAFNDALSYRTTLLASPRDVVVADFNNDGKQDFAAISPFFGFPAGGGVEVALNDGAGNFTVKSTINFFTSQLGGITAADLNADGKMDLAVTRPLDGRVFLLVNDGTGAFPTDVATIPFLSIGFQPGAIKAGDFNNDAKADLVVTNPNNYTVLLGDGNLGYQIFGGIGLPQGNGTDIDIGDFNADGKQDLAFVRSGANQVTVLRGDGAGFFISYATVALPTTSESLVVKDFNGDGKPDIATAGTAFENIVAQGYVSVVLNNGAGGFDAPVNYLTDGARSIAAGDFNNDNQQDLVVISGGFGVNSNLFSVTVLTNKGTGGQFNAPMVFGVAQDLSSLAAGDFNGDTEDDLIASQFNQTVAVLLNNFSTSVPCLSVNDATVTENDSGTVDAVFTVTLSSASAQTVRVNYFASPHFSGSINFTTATAGVDYEDVPGTITFAPGETSKTFSIPVKGDVIDELDQLFSVSLTPVNAVISDGRGFGTIVDNDAPPTISITDVAANENNPNQVSVAFTVTLSGPSEKTVTVDYATQAGTATAGTDYFTTSASIEFQPGTVSRTIFVQIIPDNIFEPNETYFVNLSNPTNATIADGQGQGTINNDDPQPTIGINSAFLTEGAQGTSSNVQVQVTLSNPSSQTITVAYATANQTATAGSDYVAASGTVTFNPGETTKNIPIQINGDDVDEISETFVVSLTNPTNATIGTAQNTVTIGDDDGPTISINSISVNEGNTGVTTATFTITLSAASVQDVLVNLATASGTATGGLDYQQVFSGTVFIPAGQTSTTVNLRVFGDFQIEPDETFTVLLQFPNNATIAPPAQGGTGTCTIVNDDSNGKLQFGSATITTTEGVGNLVVQVNRVNGSTGTITIDYATSNGTATSGSDYTATSGTLTFNQGEIAKAITIPITNDGAEENDETFSLTLSNPTGSATLGTPSTTVVTIKAAAPLLLLEDLGPSPTQVAALDALTLLRDPFPVISTVDLYNSGTDKNTRVLVFVTNVQLPQNGIVVILVGTNGQTYEITPENVQAVPLFDFVQIKFRLPDTLVPGVCNIKVRVGDLDSNQGTITIKP
jgi:hypothetical protein